MYNWQKWQREILAVLFINWTLKSSVDKKVQGKKRRSDFCCVYGVRAYTYLMSQLRRFIHLTISRLRQCRLSIARNYYTTLFGIDADLVSPFGERERDRGREKSTETSREREIITFLLTGNCGILFETEFPVSGRAPTGAHPHVAHADGIRVPPFYEDGTALTARSDRDEALEPRNREPLVLTLAEQIRRVHAHLDEFGKFPTWERKTCVKSLIRNRQIVLIVGPILPFRLIDTTISEVVANLVRLFAIVSNNWRLVFPPAEHDLVHGTRLALPVGQRDMSIALGFHVDQDRAASHGMELVL